MLKHPKIINTQNLTSDSVIMTLFIPASIIFFQGHFDGMPILPGVAQVDWAIFFACKFLHLEINKGICIDQIKFNKIIKPDSTIFLALEIKKNILHFKYYNDSSICSSGKIKT